MFSSFQNSPTVVTLSSNSVIKSIATDLFSRKKRLRLWCNLGSEPWALVLLKWKT
jgi:hypothetical protein